jgi:hypothetical protein
MIAVTRQLLVLSWQWSKIRRKRSGTALVPASRQRTRLFVDGLENALTHVLGQDPLSTVKAGTPRASDSAGSLPPSVTNSASSRFDRATCIDEAERCVRYRRA